MSRPWTATASGVALAVRLTPRGGRDSIDGIEIMADGRSVLKARVRAAPGEGEANAALVGMIAKLLGVPARSVCVTSGATARRKRIAIDGDTAALIARLEIFTATG